MTVHQRRPRVRAAAVSLTALAFFAVACGGDSGTGGEGATGAGTSTGTSMDQRLKLARCMREHGVDMPDPKPGQDGQAVAIDGNGVSPQQFAKAMEACRSVAGIPAPKPLSQEEKDRQLEYARCMREHGVNMPDPTFGSGARSALPLPSAGPEKEKFDKAGKACGAKIG